MKNTAKRIFTCKNRRRYSRERAPRSLGGKFNSIFIRLLGHGAKHSADRVAIHGAFGAGRRRQAGSRPRRALRRGGPEAPHADRPGPGHRRDLQRPRPHRDPPQRREGDIDMI